MNPIQILLIAFCAILLLYSIKKMNGIKNTIFSVVICITAFFFIIKPDYSTYIANFLGVKRGVDLLFYFSILFLFFLIIKLYTKVRNFEKKWTVFIRNNAIENVSYNNNSSPPKKEEATI